MNAQPDSRRSFVKKSLAVGIAAAQPAFFAGLVRADGGGGSGSDTKTETTDPNTTLPETTYPETGTTLPPDSSTYQTTTGY